MIKNSVKNVLKVFFSPAFKLNPKKYLNITRKFEKSKNRILRKIGTTVKYLPPVQRYQMLVKTNGVEFNYESSKLDDLNMRARGDFYDWEAKSREIWADICMDASVIIDIGSYTGVYTLIARKSNGAAEIFAFEPNPEMYEITRKNLYINNIEKSCVLYPYAAGSLRATSELFIDIAGSSGSSMKHKSVNYRSVTVQTVCIESLISVKSSDLICIKIDIEGFEVECLRGMESILRENCLIIMESNTEEELKNQQSELVNWFFPPVRIGRDQSSSDYRNYLWISRKLPKHHREILSRHGL